MRSLLPLLLVGSALAWKDCDVSPIDAKGGYPTDVTKNYLYRGHPIYVQYPTEAPPAGSKWPVIIFMHGMTLSWEWYSRHVEMWASHGFVVAFPFVKGEVKDDAAVPVTETNAASIHAAYGLMRGLANGSIPVPKTLASDNIDVANIGLAGHSMGGEDTIRAAAQVMIPRGYEPFPQGVLKVAIAQHPSLCTFPPPYPFTINKKEINNASLNQDLFLFTAESDRAFLPGTPKKEYTCWQAATGGAVFVSVNQTACASFPSCADITGAHDCAVKLKAVGKGHMCACDAPGLDTWTSPELKWVTATMRLYLHFKNASSSHCSGLVWGDGPSSLASDKNMATVEHHGKIAADIQVVV